MVVSIAAAVLLMHAACGGAAGSEEADRVEPEVWATDVCTAYRDWVAFAKSRYREVEDEARAASSVREVKTVFVTAYTELLEETDVMLKKVDAAGTPAGEHGEEVGRAVRNMSELMRRVMADVLVQARSLPTRNIDALNSELEALVDSNLRAFNEVGRQWADLDLEAELEGEPPEACRDP